jgi:hypothetical protein
MARPIAEAVGAGSRKGTVPLNGCDPRLVPHLQKNKVPLPPVAPQVEAPLQAVLVGVGLGYVLSRTKVG